jgi:hypothetical protein
MFEQGDPFEKVPVVDLSSSSDEEGLIPDTSRDKEFVKKLFSNLNRSVIGPPDDGKIIILSDFDEEEEVHEEDVANTEATHLLLLQEPQPQPPSPLMSMKLSRGCKTIIMMILPPNQETSDGDNGGEKDGSS